MSSGVGKNAAFQIRLELDLKHPLRVRSLGENATTPETNRGGHQTRQDFSGYMG